MINRLYVVAIMLLVYSNISSAFATASSVYIEELTSPEIRIKIDGGATTVIIPTGGSEQNLAHLTIGKHNYIVNYTAGEIAKKLGNTLVAPTIGYVPEGNITPPEGHMKFAGTISLKESTYEALLEDTAQSLKQHGFKLICFLGDSGGNQAVQARLAVKLSQKWQGDGVRVLQVANYYANNGQNDWVTTLKLQLKAPAEHASFEDTSELMAINIGAVRTDLRTGDAKLASSEYGKKLLELKINTAVSEIRNATKP